MNIRILTQNDYISLSVNSSKCLWLSLSSERSIIIMIAIIILMIGENSYTVIKCASCVIITLLIFCYYYFTHQCFHLSSVLYCYPHFWFHLL